MKTNIKNVPDKKLGIYLRDSGRKFCQSCGDLTNTSELFAQMYANGLYGYTCENCNE